VIDKEGVMSRSTLAAFLVCALAAGVGSASAAELHGVVKDGTGGVLPDARITVLSPQRSVMATTTTDQNGAFTVSGLPDGQYIVTVERPPLADKQVSVVAVGTAPVSLSIELETVRLDEGIRVTATPGLVQDTAGLTQPVNLITAEDVLERAKTVVAQAVEGEAAVNLQRTSPGMAGIFVRGLTGNKVNVFVDGVRYSNGAQRGGVNTFLDLIDPMTLEGIEVLRGTSSAQYGSDALGGSVQFLTHIAPLATNGQRSVRGTVTVGGETAHSGGVGNLALAYSRARFGLYGSVAGRKTGDYRPGGGVDSHAATIRFLGVPTDRLIDERMPDTGFHQVGTQLRANWVPSSNVLFVANYLSSRQDARR
jgi:outer membrane receptor protein involved in Fe transport